MTTDEKTRTRLERAHNAIAKAIAGRREALDGDARIRAQTIAANVDCELNRLALVLGVHPHVGT